LKISIGVVVIGLYTTGVLHDEWESCVVADKEGVEFVGCFGSSSG